VNWDSWEESEFCGAGRSVTLDRVTTYWMPELQRLGVQVPVILVGCKSDLRVTNDHHLQHVRMSNWVYAFLKYKYMIKQMSGVQGPAVQVAAA
jgi:GTPase SAR1 family protein